MSDLHVEEKILERQIKNLTLALEREGKLVE